MSQPQILRTISDTDLAFQSSQKSSKPELSCQSQSVRKMERQGDDYVGDVDGDGQLDVWVGVFNAKSPYGVGTFQFSDLQKDQVPAVFKNSQGKSFLLGDQVDVLDATGELQQQKIISHWDLTVTRGDLLARPDFILVSVNFYSQKVSQGLGVKYQIDCIRKK